MSEISVSSTPEYRFPVLKHRIGRAVRFAAAVLTSLLVSSVFFDHIILNDSRISTLAVPTLLVAIVSMFGMFSSPHDRAFATGVVVGFPFSFFILQYKLSFLIDSPDLRSGAALILTIASALAVLIWLIEGTIAWRSKRRAYAAKS